MAQSIPTYMQSATARDGRNAEYVGTPFTDPTGDGTYADPYLGMNRAGSNAPGIGIATGVVSAETTADIRPDNWTLLDQFAVQRVPQYSEHISGIDEAAPAYDGTTPYPTPAEGGVTPCKFIQGADTNDVANYVVADTAAIDGAIADTATGTLNNTGATIEIGNVLWGVDPQA